MNRNDKFKKKREQRQRRVALTLIDDKLTIRSCGDCKACCTILAVHELHKPANTPCKHLCETGCSIYEKRPVTCFAWFCLWRWSPYYDTLPDDKKKIREIKSLIDLQIPDNMRPDQCGIMLDFRPREAYELATVVRPEFDRLFVVHELWEGAANQHAELLDRLMIRLPVLICSPELKFSLWRIPEVTLVEPRK